jgi:hypothetical protein
MKPALAENHYLLAPAFITPERAAELAADFAEVERQGRYTKDAQAPSSPAVYNFLPFVRLMVEKVPHVSEMLGEPVLPTYTYARSYKHGEILHRHRDRDACEISFTLNLAQDVDWPIYIQKPSGEEIAVSLNPGDAVMYLGCETDHWRQRYTGKSHMQLFIHYVRAYGPRAYTFFNIARTPPAENEKPAQFEHNAKQAERLPTSFELEQRARPFTRDVQKVGRNELCPCGSGKKFKHCHG